MCFIYLITNNINGKQYVGQTTQTVEERYNRGHVRSAKRLQRARDENDTKYICGNIYLYGDMLKYGIENFSVEMLYECDENELDDTEIYLIKEYNTLVPNGYNLTTGGGHFRHHELTKQIMREKAIEAAPLHLDKYRREETKGLPMYIVSHNKGNSRGFAVCGHPKCSYKSFTMNNYDTLEECKQAALKHLEHVDKLEQKHHCGKKNPELPTGITRFRNGYLAKRKIDGVIHKQAFEGKHIDDDVKLQRAIDYLNSL